MTATPDTPPTNRYAAASWLAGRHDRVRQLAARLGAYPLSDDDVSPSGPIDPDLIAQAVHESDAHTALWRQYEATTPAPRDDTGYDAWHQAGPQSSDRARAFGVMSSGEKAIMRLVATLGELDRDNTSHTVRPLWWIGDVSSYDHAGALILADWLAIVRAQLPEALYAGPIMPLHPVIPADPNRSDYGNVPGHWT